MASVEQIVAELPRRFPGPGGACAVIRDGEVLVRHAWGWADAERRIAFTPDTLFRICSITKQFSCALVLDIVSDPSQLDAAVGAYLPALQVSPPKTVHLCHNQSGLRDYWAVAMLHGAPAESSFGEIETKQVLGGTKSLQFSPGTRYSYCNQNFRILSDLLQEQTGRSFAELLRTRLFDRIGMRTAILAADTAALPDGATGYEGSQSLGFRPARNRLIWTGDAGIAASLDDMIAWERHIDETRHDPDSLYNRLSQSVTFSDGTPSHYGFGLGRRTISGRTMTAHGGALRGWRSHRLHVASERLSVIVLFNHMSDAQQAAHLLLLAILDEMPEQAVNDAAVPSMAGTYVEPETGLAVRVEPGRPGYLQLQYDRHPEYLAINPDGTAGSADAVLLRRVGEVLWMDRASDHQSTALIPRAAGSRVDIAGRYRCDELEAELVIENAGFVLYGAFSGFLGRGRMELLDSIALDLWALPCPRALDHTSPGDWTIDVQRDPAGNPVAIHLGCWLARGLVYRRIS